MRPESFFCQKIFFRLWIPRDLKPLAAPIARFGSYLFHGLERPENGSRNWVSELGFEPGKADTSRQCEEPLNAILILRFEISDMIASRSASEVRTMIQDIYGYDHKKHQAWTGLSTTGVSGPQPKFLVFGHFDLRILYFSGMLLPKLVLCIPFLHRW